MVSHQFIGMHGKLLGLAQRLAQAQVAGVVMVVRVEEEKEELSLQPLQLQQNKQELVSVIELLQLLSNSLLEAELSLLSTFNSCALETSRLRYKN